MRTLLYALLVAAVPFGLLGHLAGAEGPGAGFPAGVPADRWMRIGIVAGTAVLLLLAYRRRAGLLGPGIAAGLALAAWPAAPDAVASPFGTAVLVHAAACAGALLLLAWFPGGGGERDRLRRLFPAVAAYALVVAADWSGSGSGEYGAGALGRGALASVAAGVLAGEASLHLVRRGVAGSPARRALAAGLAVLLLGSAALGQLRAFSWSDPVSFWDRAAAESPRSPVALGASAGARADAGDRAGAAERLQAFVEVLAARAGGAGDCGPEARRAGAEGAARAATLLLEGTDPRDRESARAALNAANDMAPGDVPVLVALGDARILAGDMKEALRIFGDAVGRDPESADAWDGLARARIAAGLPFEAMEPAQRAAGLRPREKRFVVTYSRALLSLGRGAESLQSLWEALGPAPPYDPMVARAFGETELRIARGAVSAGRKGQARRMLAAALNVDPGNGECRDLLDRLDREMEVQRPEAEKLLAPGPDGKVKPNDWYGYALWLCRWGEYEKAEPHWERILKAFSTDEKVWYQYGFDFWEARGTVEGSKEAVKAYRNAIALKRDFPDAWNRLWQCLHGLSEITEARKAARVFLEYGGDHPDAPGAVEFLERTTDGPPGGGPR
jgi:tetratricopeptide (TPR) repeat protein